ncbi:MAG: DUF721 domain-containing protein [Verrucomicrobia bacterium]|nr:DUF721 domain-containing protein [Verrucomicrobiota bacterium]
MSLARPAFFPAKGPPRSSPREKSLNAWRGVNERETAKLAASPHKSAGDIMPSVLKAIRMDRRQTEAEVAKAWTRLVDPAVAAHAQPAGLAKGTLFVTVDNSAWLSEIVRYRRKEILERLQLAFGKQMIARISFRCG